MKRWINNRPSITRMPRFSVEQGVFVAVITQPWRRLTHSDGSQRERGRRGKGEWRKRIRQSLVDVFHVNPLFLIPPLASSLLSCLHRPLSSFEPAQSPHARLFPPPDLLLIVSGSPPINRMNVFSDALRGALAPLGCFTALGIVPDRPLVSLFYVASINFHTFLQRHPSISDAHQWAWTRMALTLSWVTCPRSKMHNLVSAFVAKSFRFLVESRV